MMVMKKAIINECMNIEHARALIEMKVGKRR